MSKDIIEAFKNLNRKIKIRYDKYNEKWIYAIKAESLGSKIVFECDNGTFISDTQLNIHLFKLLKEHYPEKYI